MTVALTSPPKAATRLFLGVEQSVCGRPWRDNADTSADMAPATAIDSRAVRCRLRRAAAVMRPPVLWNADMLSVGAKAAPSK